MRIHQRTLVLLALASGGALAQAPAAPLGGAKLEVPFFQLRLNASSLALKDAALKAAPVTGDYGKGFDSATGETLGNVCVKIVALPPKGGTVTSPAAENVYHESISLEQTRSDTKTSASASLLYDAFSASIGGSVVNGNFSNSYSRYVTAHREIVVNEFVGTGVGPNGNYELTQTALDNLKLGPATFRAVCGDHFVSGYKLGGVFNVVAAVRATTDSSFNQHQTDIGVGFADIFGANFSQSANYSKVRMASSFDVRDLSVGVVSPAVTLETLSSAYTNYEALVKQNPGLLSFVFTPYSQLGGQAAGIPDFSALESAKLGQLAAKRDRARTNSNDLDLALTAKSQGADLFAIDGDPEAARKEFDDYFSAIAVAVDKCRHSTTPPACTAAVDAVPAVPKARVSRKTPP